MCPGALDLMRAAILFSRCVLPRGGAGVCRGGFARCWYYSSASFSKRHHDAKLSVLSSWGDAAVAASTAALASLATIVALAEEQQEEGQMSTLMLSAKELENIAEHYSRARSVEHTAAAFACAAAIAGDFLMLTGTGLVGVLAAAGGVSWYVYSNTSPLRMPRADGEIEIRRQYCDVPKEMEMLSGIKNYQTLMADPTFEVLPDHSEHVRRVSDISHILLEANADYLSHCASMRGRWTFHVVDNDEKNAFVIPGGFIFVNRGLCEAFADDPEALAVIIAHELGHAYARHVAERISIQRFSSLLRYAYFFLSIFGIVEPATTLGIARELSGIDAATQLTIQLPFSRLHESEADAIGIAFLANSCIDPAAADRAWKKMASESAKESESESELSSILSSKNAVASAIAGILELLSTHPDREKRIEKIKSILPAEKERFAQQCTSGTCDEMAQLIRKQVK